MQHDAHPAGRDPHGPHPKGGTGASAEPPRHSLWWMVACCAPMVLIAVALLLGVFGAR